MPDELVVGGAAAIETAGPETGRNKWRRLPSWRTLARRGWPLALGLLAIAAALFLYDRFAAPPLPPTMAEIDARAAQILADPTPAPPASATAYQVILPSLVVVRTDGAPPDTGGRIRAGLPAPAPLRTNFAAAQPAQTAPTQGNGSGIGGGVVISSDGAILTAFHVVGYAGAIDVIFADGTESPARLVAAEPDNDIAVLQPDRLPETFAPATLGNPGALRIGDQVFAVGNPLGLAGSLSAGVVSGLDRSYRTTAADQPLERLIQFDAAVNPGNPGGPLLNRNGEVVGIVVGAVSPTQAGTFIGIGLAVRIDVATVAAGAPEQ